MQFFFGLNRSLRVLLFTNSIVAMAGAMLGPIYAIFVTRIGGDILDAGLTGAAYMMAVAATTYLTGATLDHIKYRRMVLLVAYIVLAVAFVLYIFVDSVGELFLVQLLVGAANAMYAPAMDTLYANHTAPTKAGRSWALLEASESVIAAIGAVIGGVMVTYLGFNSIFITMSALCLFSALYIITLPRTQL